MKVGLIGYFGSEAYSDDLIEHVTKSLLLEVEPEIQFDSTILNKGQAGSNPDYLNKFDLIIHCGGSLLGKCTHYPIMNISQWANKVKTPLAVFGIGYRYEPDKEPLTTVMKERINTLFDKAEIVTVRGCYTVKHLKENNIDTSKICSLADPVMACRLKFPLLLKNIIAGNVRNMPQVEVQHNSTEKVQKLMAECYDWLIEKYNKGLFLLSFRHNIESDNDIIGAQKTRELMRYKDRVTTYAVGNVMNTIKFMSNAKFYFGQRLHPTIYAATQGVPFVGVEYQFDKMLDWTSTVGIDNIIHTKDAKLEDFIDAHDRVESNREILRKTMPKKSQEIRETAKNIINLV
jgi:polysaccharide pyruvyl transferase WcaK-like protein